MCAGRRVLNALYTLCKKSSESNMTSHLAHVTKTTSQTLFFSRILKSKGGYCDFCNGFYSNAHSVLRFRSISRSCLLALEAMPTIKYLNRALSLVNI